MEQLPTLLIKASKFGSGRSDRLDTNFFRHVGHSLLPRSSAVVIHSLQNRCKHSYKRISQILLGQKNLKFINSCAGNVVNHNESYGTEQFCNSYLSICIELSKFSGNKIV